MRVQLEEQIRPSRRATGGLDSLDKRAKDTREEERAVKP
jgi:hypothetical protein